MEFVTGLDFIIKRNAESIPFNTIHFRMRNPKRLDDMFNRCRVIKLIKDAALGMRLLQEINQLPMKG